MRRAVALEADEEEDDGEPSAPDEISAFDHVIGWVVRIGFVFMVAAFVVAIWLEATGSATPTAALSEKVMERTFVAPFYAVPTAHMALRVLYIAGAVLLVGAGFAASARRQLERLRTRRD
jgi:hypothetical protein